jgi:hypothetical protein
MLPDEEIDALDTAVHDAVALAAEGKLVAGYDLLRVGLRYARQELLAGSPWGKELMGRYRLAMENYIASYGVRMG